jgi:hypothetical protein
LQIEKKEKTIHQFELKAPMHRDWRSLICDQLLTSNKLVKDKDCWASNFGSILLSTEKPGSESLKFLNKENVHIDPIGAFRMSELANYLETATYRGDGTEEDFVTSFVKVLNTLVAHRMRIEDKYKTIGSSKHFCFDEKTANGMTTQHLGGGLVAVRGFFTSVRLGAGRILLNINVTHGAFYHGGRLDEVMEGHLELLAEEAKKDRGSWGVHELSKLDKFLQGVHVTFNLSKPEKVLRIQGLASGSDGPTGNRPRMQGPWNGRFGDAHTEFYTGSATLHQSTNSSQDRANVNSWTTVLKYFNVKFRRSLDSSLRFDS